MEVVRKKVSLESLKDGDCFYDDEVNFQYSIKTDMRKTENNEILTVNLQGGEAYWEKEDVMVIPVKAKILIEGEEL